jgi:hypothetical protein
LRNRAGANTFEISLLEEQQSAILLRSRVSKNVLFSLADNENSASGASLFVGTERVNVTDERRRLHEIIK